MEHPDILPRVLSGINTYSINLVQRVEEMRRKELKKIEKERRTEIQNLEKKRRTEIQNLEKERRTEIKDLIQNLEEKRRSEIQIHIEELTKIRAKLELQTERLLRAEDRCDALEYIREQVLLTFLFR